MERAFGRWGLLLAAWVAVLLGSSQGLLPSVGRVVQAQTATIPCATAATPPATESTPATGGTPVVAPPVSMPFPAEGGQLTVFAAASLTAAFERIGADLEAAHPGLRVEYNFAGSQALVTQIAEGADADVFAAAGPEPMDVALAAGLIDAQPVDIARNRLAIVVPKENPGEMSSAVDLAKSGLKLVLAAPDVPVGRYAREAICAMGTDVPSYGEGFVDRVTANVVSEEDNVKAVLAKVRLGEADAGIVYTTDITPDVTDDVSVVAIPPTVNVVAHYPIAPVRGGDTALAGAFIAYLLSPEGQSTLQAFGFEPIS